MLPTLIVLLLTVVAVAAIIWVVRKGPTHVVRPGDDQDPAWSDSTGASERKPEP